MMQDFGADIPKMAVMPTCKQDVLTLLSATLEMSEKYADRPIITMSMAGTGVVSRLTGETFGSALTFGAASKASAPGQVGVHELKQVLDFFSKGFQLDRKIFSPKPTASAHADAHAVPWVARTAAITPAIILSLSLLQ